MRLIEQNVPRHMAEKAADEQVVQQLAAPSKPLKPRKTAGWVDDLEVRKFRVWCRGNDVPMPTPEYEFALEAKPPKRYRFDFAWVPEKVALEVQGGIFRKGGGAHTGKNHIRDMHKANLAQNLGWEVLQCTPGELYNGTTLDRIRTALAQRSAA